MANAPKANMRKRNASRKGGASATRKTAQAPARQRFALPWLNHLMIFAGVAFVAVAAVQAWLTLDAIPVEQISVKGVGPVSTLVERHEDIEITREQRRYTDFPSEKRSSPVSDI